MISAYISATQSGLIMFKMPSILECGTNQKPHYCMPTDNKQNYLLFGIYEIIVLFLFSVFY